MGSPTLEKGPWIFNVNNLFVESTGYNRCKRELLELKNCLVALGGAETIWKVIASCDGTTVWNIDPEEEDRDLWDDITDMVHSTAGNPHSWCILKNLTTNGQLLIDYVRPSAMDYPHYAEIRYSPSGAFSDTGTTGNAPTSTDSIQIWDRNYTFTDSAYYNGLDKVVINVMTSADHKITRWYNRSRYSNGWSGGTIGFIEEIQDTPAIWNSTIKTAITFSRWNCTIQSYTPSALSPQVSKIDDGNVFYVRFETAEPYAGWLSTYTGCAGYSSLYSANAKPLFFSNIRQGVNNNYPVSPILLFRSAGIYGGPLGRLADIYFAQDSHHDLDTYPSNDSRLWVKWGCFMVPWNGTLPVEAR